MLMVNKDEYIIILPWYFIPRVLKLANAKMYARNGYDGDSETVNCYYHYHHHHHHYHRQYRFRGLKTNG